MWELEGKFDASESWKQGELDLTNWLSSNYCVRPGKRRARGSTHPGQRGNSYSTMKAMR